jgi:hypothetical protein
LKIRRFKGSVYGFGCPQGAETRGIENIGVTPGFHFGYGLAGPVAAAAIKNHLPLLVFANGEFEGVGFVPWNIQGTVDMALSELLF